MKIIKNFITHLILLTLTSLVLAYFVMLLWNNVIPMVFNLNEITFWQSFQLNLLSAILLKSNNLSTFIPRTNSEYLEKKSKNIGNNK